jgi:hypothetical protein
MDNWIYGSKFPQRMRLSGGTWATQPNLSMRGQWGLSHDNYGRFVYASNGDHLRGDLVPGHYYTRNPNYSATAGVDVRYPADQTVWPHGATPGVNRRGQVRDENGTLQQFTANTAPAVYRGNQFPSEFVGNVFLGDVAGRLIRRSVLTEKDGIITAENAYPKREFLFSHDERFRPVFTANGPDGALYVTDMYRGIIEGHLFITSYLRQQIIARGLEQSFLGMGRIYRIVHAGRPFESRPAGSLGRTPRASERLLARCGAAHHRRKRGSPLDSLGATNRPRTCRRTGPAARAVDARGSWRRGYGAPHAVPGGSVAADPNGRTPSLGAVPG